MDSLAERFEEHRTHLRSVAYRMLGSLADADEAVQDTWLRASRAGAEGVENMRAWLTTIVARVCLNMLQARKVRDAARVHLPDPVVAFDEADPEHDALLADSVGLALQIVLETLAPAERVAFVLHDMFDVPFEEIATMLGRSPVSARQLASRAHRRVRDVSMPDADLARQRTVIDAFFAAERSGDYESLIAVLDPDVVLRADGGERLALSFVRRGADEVARNAVAYAFPSALLVPVLVNGTAGVVVMLGDGPFAVMAFTVVSGRIAEIDVVADATRIARLSQELTAARVRPPS
jgi:RNA polymerase sigma-70 factor (ECF subfamily)